MIFILPQQCDGNSHGREGRHMGQENMKKLLDFTSILKTMILLNLYLTAW